MIKENKITNDKNNVKLEKEIEGKSKIPKNSNIYAKIQYPFESFFSLLWEKPRK